MVKKKIMIASNKRNLIYFIGVMILSYSLFILFSNKAIDNTKIVFLASSTTSVNLYDGNFNLAINIPRGLEVIIDSDKRVENDNNIYYELVVNGEKYYVMNDNLVDNKREVVLEKKIYVRTAINLLSSEEEGKLLALVNKGDELEVIGYDEINSEGKVITYKVKHNDLIGNIYAKYTVFDKESALLHYQPEKYYNVHFNRGNTYGGGHAGNLDYYPVEKFIFENNIMPDPVYALYLNASSNVISNIEKYIELAEGTEINAFVVDIKDNKSGGYKSEVMKKYSITSYNKAHNSFEDYKLAINKLKDAGFYVIGRITLFKDEYFVNDNPEYAIANKITNEPYLHQNTYWPSPFQRYVWEYNVELAKEAVKEMGFNEIQFDYVRFPDRTGSAERQGLIDFKNEYNEEKAQAIQRFLMYACDELRKLNVYVSADVFGESAHTYVAAYGQYWPAISNVVDVISGMPYPDHFSAHEYGFEEVVWTIPYDLLYHWGKNYVMKRQQEIPTPAKLRTWVQGYDTIRAPYIIYNADKVEAQIRGLFDAGLNNGYMIWNAKSSLSKYKAQIEAYKKDYR